MSIHEDFQHASEVLPAKLAPAPNAGSVAPEGVTTPEEKCPACDQTMLASWTPFPPALKEKFGRDGEWLYLPCTPQCEEVAERKEWEREVRQKKIEGLMRRSGMPRRLAAATFENYDSAFSPAAKRAESAALRYINLWPHNRDEGRGLYLCGGVGTGKTHVAAALARTLVEYHHVPTLFVTVPELLDHMRPGIREAADERDEWATAAMNADLLILDDVGTEKGSEWVRERLFVLVNHRYREQLPTIYTSNIGPRDLSGQLGERVASRLVETCEFVLVDGPDYRIAKASEAEKGKS